MTSVNFNSAATSALRTLQATNTSLDATQNRISTGLKIGEAKDNAAYWSISTTLKSDNKTMETVTDALSLGSGTVDTAYQGLNSALDVLNEIKSKITAATQAGVDKTAIQAEISALQKQLDSIATSSSFSGENWLSRLTTADVNKTVVSGYNRASNGSVSISTIELNIGATSLLVKAADGTLSTSAGILSQNRSGGAGYAVTGATATGVSGGAIAAPVVFDGDDVITFNVTTPASGSQLVTINQATLTAAGVGSSTISTSANLEKVLNQALKSANVAGLSAKVSDAGVVTWASTSSFSVGPATNASGSTPVAVAAVGLSGAATYTGAAATVEASVQTINVTGANLATLTAYIDIVSAAAREVTSQAANLGAVSKRIELQQTFVKNLMDTIDKGVSSLIDADMNEESTKLQALQVKQQLGVQALSIANQSAQNVLSLFRS